MIKTTLKEELLNLTDSELNSVVTIKNTDYNKNVRYGAQTKKMWDVLYNAEGLGRMSISEIAKAWGTSYNTVRKAVDPEYRERLRVHRNEYQKTYERPEREYDPNYRPNLIARKRELISSEMLGHLKSF